jgi:hypothetical protein
MSAQAIDLGQLTDSLVYEETISHSLYTNDSPEVVAGMPFEAAYQALFGAEPSAEDIRREYFLLECD